MNPWLAGFIGMVLGGMITSFIEYKLKYNLTDEEVDLAKSIFAKASTAEKNVLSKLSSFGHRLEFWKKA